MLVAFDLLGLSECFLMLDYFIVVFQAVSHVANLISQGNFEALDGLVAKEVCLQHPLCSSLI